jgi:hypothetical protein
MQLDDALDQLSAIHAQVLRSEVFRGCRAAPVALTGVIALGVAAVQDLALAPLEVPAFVMLWVGVACLCTVICCADLIAGCLRRNLPRGTGMVMGQLLPAAAAGALLTIALLRAVPAEAGLLPGVWALVFGVGVFAARPYLPRAVGWVAAWYCLAGSVQLLATDGGGGVPPTPSAWGMGITFGIGQLAAGVVLRCDLERAHDGR